MKIEEGNRESWLRALYRMVRAEMLPEAPETAAISWSLPSKRGSSSKRRTIGECWSKESGASNLEGRGHAILISPTINDDSGMGAAETLVHEMVHAALPPGTGHKGAFVSVMKRVGLEGKPTATHAGAVLKEKLEVMIRKLPAWPKGHLTIRPKDKSRQLKAMCDCGRILRMSQKVIDQGPVICGLCEEPFVMEG